MPVPHCPASERRIHSGASGWGGGEAAGGASVAGTPPNCLMQRIAPAAVGAAEDAENELLAALASLPTSVEAALQLAALRRSLRRADETIDLLVTVLQRDPWNLDALAYAKPQDVRVEADGPLRIGGHQLDMVDALEHPASLLNQALMMQA